MQGLCGKDDDPAEPGTESGTGGAVTINAKVENGSNYNSKADNVKALMDVDEERDEETGDYYWVGYTVASGQYKDGGFTINLPETVDSKYLSTPGLEKGVTLSDTNIKGGSIEFFVAYKSGVEVGDIYYATYSPASEPTAGTDAAYMHVDRGVKITGSGVDEDGDNFSYNASLKKDGTLYMSHCLILKKQINQHILIQLQLQVG